MSNPIPRLHPRDQAELFKRHDRFKKSACLTGCSTAAASFLILGALIVIGGSCLCLTLPGINVVNQVILPGVLPGAGGVILSIPFIAYSVHKSRATICRRRELIDFNTQLLNGYEVDQMPSKEGAKFVKNRFLKKNWSKEYKKKVLDDIKERIPEDETPEHEALSKTLDKATKLIYERK